MLLYDVVLRLIGLCTSTISTLIPERINANEQISPIQRNLLICLRGKAWHPICIL